MRSVSPNKTPESDGPGTRSPFAPTRRGLIAALAVMSTVAGASAAHAGAIFPWWAHRRRGDHHHHPCFLSGTRIRTPKGEVAVEALEIGDLVETVSGEAKPIKWIGRRRFERTGDGTWPTNVMPIRVARSAFGPLAPHSDLFLSEAHAVYLDGLLIPIKNLINGRSIVRCSSFDAETIDYFHIELAGHDVIFAEGAPTETLLGRGESEFDNEVGREGVSQSMPLGPSEPFAPIVPMFNNRATVRSRLRSAVSPWVDRRQPTDMVWDRLAERAETQIAA